MGTLKSVALGVFCVDWFFMDLCTCLQFGQSVNSDETPTLCKELGQALSQQTAYMLVTLAY